MKEVVRNPGIVSLKGLSYEIDFENVDENWQILALKGPKHDQVESGFFLHKWDTYVQVT